MEPEVLDKRRPLTEEEVAQIAEGLRRPKDVDETLFTSVVGNMIGKYSAQITGVETDPIVKAALMRREQSEQDRLARIQIKLTQGMRKHNNFPSIRDEALPKYYDEAEIPGIIQEWIRRIQADVDDTFDYKGDLASVEEITTMVNQVMEKGKMVLTEKIFNSIVDRLLELRIEQNRLQEVEECLLRMYEGPQEDMLSEIQIVEICVSGERSLTVEQIDGILDDIDYAPYFKGDQANITMDPLVNKLSRDRTRADLKRQLKRIKIKPESYDRLRELLLERFHKAQALTGKWVGNIMASSFGEAATQQTLNTFHAAGDRNARKQITGFAKLNSILEAVENPQGTTITIFMKERFTGEQLRLRQSDIQMTTLSDLIESHRVINSASPVPRWELVHDVVNGIAYDITYDARRARLNLHRRNPLFAPDPRGPDETKGRILEIKFDSKEMFFRRISMSQIANAIEETSSHIRVVTSSIDIGRVYVYYKFTGLATMENVKGEIPSFAQIDPFEFALTNVVYPSLLSIQIGGIYGIDHTYVQSYKIADAIDFARSEVELNTPNRRIFIQFVPHKTIMWALTEGVISEFIMTKIQRFTPRDYEVNPLYDEDTGVYSFDTAGLRIYDYEVNEYRSLTMSNLQDELTVDSKIKVYELLRHTHLPSVEVETRIPNENLLERNIIGSQLPHPTNPILNTPEDRVPAQLEEKVQQLRNFREQFLEKPVRTSPSDPDTVIIELDQVLLTNLGFDIDDIATNLSSIFSFDNVKVEARASRPDAQIFLTGVEINPEEEFNAEVGADISGYVESQLKKVQLSSDRMEQFSLKWYYSTEGKNLIEVLAHPDVDAEHTRSDNIVEVYRALGVESCRTILLEEIAANTDSKINPVHIELLADALTYRTPGDKPLSQNHHGMTKRGAEFISRMWEKTTSVAMRAGLGEVDNLQSFSSQIMTGNLNTAGRLTVEDREKIYKDRDVFPYDFPEEAPIAPLTPQDPVPAIDVKVIKDEPAAAGMRLGRLGRKAGTKKPSSRQRLTEPVTEMQSPSRLSGLGGDL